LEVLSKELRKRLFEGKNFVLRGRTISQKWRRILELGRKTESYPNDSPFFFLKIERLQ